MKLRQEQTNSADPLLYSAQNDCIEDVAGQVKENVRKLLQDELKSRLVLFQDDDNEAKVVDFISEPTFLFFFYMLAHEHHILCVLQGKCEVVLVVLYLLSLVVLVVVEASSRIPAQERLELDESRGVYFSHCSQLATDTPLHWLHFVSRAFRRDVTDAEQIRNQRFKQVLPSCE